MVSLLTWGRNLRPACGPVCRDVRREVETMGLADRFERLAEAQVTGSRADPQISGRSCPAPQADR